MMAYVVSFAFPKCFVNIIPEINIKLYKIINKEITFGSYYLNVSLLKICFFPPFRYVYKKTGNIYRAYLLGVVSRGSQCATRNKPGIYTNVLTFLPWILNIIKDGSC